MAKYNSSSTALKTRAPRRILLWVIIGALLLALLGVIVTLAQKEEAPAAEPVPTAESVISAEPVSTAAPDEAAPAPTPEAMLSVPAETESESVQRAARKRDAFPMLTLDTSLLSANEAGRLSYSGSGVKTRTGIDVSEHQGEIDWNAVAADGIDFAMIRMGYRGSTSGGLYTDEYFTQNMRGAAEAGIPVGVYFYSQATTTEEAQEEADFVLDAIRDYEVTYPVVFDWEIVGGSEARTYDVSRSTLRDCTRVFCDAVKDAGYEPMVYFTRYLAYRKYILRSITDYGFWYAEYGTRPQFVFDFDMWQYSDTGTVAGIDGAVDLNIFFY